MKKLLKSVICGSVNSAYVHYSLRKSTSKTREKKKNAGTKRNAVYVCVWVRLSCVAFLVPAFWFLFFFNFFFLCFHVFFEFCDYCSLNNSRKCWLSAVNSAYVYCLRTHKFHFLSIFSLKMGLTVLFTHLKIILLQCFQFLVSAK